MKETLFRRAGSLLGGLCLLAGAALATGAAGAEAKSARAACLPAKQETQTGVTVYSNAKASVDASNLSEGYLIVAYTGGKSVRIKVQIAKTGGATYTYDLNNAGEPETFPLTEGDGAYSVKVFENTNGSKYAQAYSTSVKMTLRNDFLPFLYSNQYVNYTTATGMSTEMGKIARFLTDTKQKKTTLQTRLDKVGKVFDFVVDHFTYDYDKASTVSSGYLPVVDDILAAKKGICFDYAAVMASMLRSQNIPCKLVVGYAGTIYHAWIDVYVEGTGWIAGAIRFDGKDWTLMDPTFVSSGKRSPSIMEYVTTDSNYSQKYAY